MIKRVGAGGPGVDLVVDQVVELEHVDVAHGDPLVELLAGAAVVEDGLAVLGQAGVLEALADRVLGGPVEDRADRLEPELGRGPAQVGLEDLADVHTARHAQRVQQDLDRRAVGQERHVLLGEDLGDDPLVAVAAGHLVADRDHPLGRDVDLDHLEHARGELVAPLQAVEPAVLLVAEGSIRGAYWRTTLRASAAARGCGDRALRA